MKTKLIEKKVKVAEVTYPRLMKHKYSDTVVLVYSIKEDKKYPANSTGNGVVVNTGDDNSDFLNVKVGQYKEDWLIFNFEDYTGKVVLQN